MPAKYTITGQKQSSQINAAGNGFQNVWEVTYKVTDGPAKGTVGTVSIPEEDHNATYVQQAIADKVTDLSAVAQLGGMT
jgi:hypothetical protein